MLTDTLLRVKLQKARYLMREKANRQKYTKVA